MKKVEGIIRPHLLPAVRSALHRAGVGGVRVSEVKGFGRPADAWGGRLDPARRTAFLPKLRVEVAIDDGALEPVVAAFRACTASGRRGGEVLLARSDDVVRIRTEEQAESAA